MKFYICKHCGNVITKLTSAQVPVKCCGEEMHVLSPTPPRRSTCLPSRWRAVW